MKIVKITIKRKIIHLKNKTEIDMSNIIKAFTKENEEEERFENKKDINLTEIYYDSKDEDKQILNDTFKKRGTLVSGVFDDENYLKNRSIDFGE